MLLGVDFRHPSKAWDSRDYLIDNWLSIWWKPVHLHQNKSPSMVYSIRVLSYIPGMIASAFETVAFIVSTVVFSTIILPLMAMKSFLIDKNEYSKLEFLKLSKRYGVTCLRIGPAIIGIICPYVRYRLDETIARTMYSAGSLDSC